MGRETVAVCEWEGERAEVKVLLETTEIILRGDIKARISRSDIRTVTLEADDLIVKLADKKLILELGEKEAAKWLDALSKPPPSLAAKLGLSPTKKAFVLGNADDAELKAALKGHEAEKASDAFCIVAILKTQSDLEKALKKAIANPDLFLWCIYPKGKGPTPSDAEIRGYLRANNYIDSKSCAISTTLTATRYGKKAAA